jgi:hypothetical protein
MAKNKIPRIKGKEQTAGFPLSNYCIPFQVNLNAQLTIPIISTKTLKHIIALKSIKPIA